MPLNIGDYRKDTAHLGAAEHGAYLLLIMHYWQTGGLPDDDRQLSRIACMNDREWKRSRSIVQAFFHDGWKHKRIDRELAHAHDVISKRRAAAQQRYSKSDASASANAGSKECAKGGDTRVPPSPTHKHSEAIASGGEPPKLPDPRELLWEAGPGALVAMGASEKEARSNIGRWLKTHQPGAVLDAIQRARDHGTKDPIPLVGRILQPVNGASHGTLRTAAEPRKPSVLDVAKRRLAELEQREAEDAAIHGPEGGHRDLRLISQA